MILGMDGGGSKTRFLLCDMQGTVLADLQREACNYLQVGFVGLKQRIEAGIAASCREAGIKSETLQYAVLGVPAYGEIAKDKQRIDALLADIKLSCSYSTVNDVKLAWAGAFACEPGIVILSGTGSMAYGVDQNHRDWRSGGWGHGFGDEGSAYWLGLESCRLFSKMSDGRKAKGPLYEMIRSEFQFSDDFELIDIVSRQMKNPRKEIAVMASLLHRAAEDGDQEAAKIFTGAGVELASLVSAITMHPDFAPARELKLSYAGGSFAAGGLLLNAVRSALSACISQKYRLSAPLLDPAQGACLYAAIRLAGNDFLQLSSGEFMGNLTGSVGI